MADETKGIGLARMPGEDKNEGVGTFVYDDVGNRLGQGQMSPRKRENKNRRVGPFPKTTTGFDATPDQN